MASKLIEMAKAAELLGMSAEQLAELREQNEIHGYRDGASWKFKMEEIERVAQERGVDLAKSSSLDLPSTSDLKDDLDDLLSDVQADDDDSDEMDSILVSEEALGHSGESTSSTIIGKGGAKATEDSDIQLAPAGSEVELTADARGTDPNLVAGQSDALGLGSDIVAADSGVKESDTGRMGSDPAMDDDDLALAADSSLTLSDDDDDDLQLAPSGSEVSLVADDDDDLVLGGSGVGSDVTLGAGDSGINLSPTDSGLSLEEEPLDLGGSSVEQLELPEDDDMISLEEEPTDPDAATQLKADDEFLLTPVEEMADDESSGSQVIALEDSDVYADAEAQTMLGAGGFGQEAVQPALVAEDADMMGVGVEAQGGVAAQPMVAPAPMPELPEAKYSVWNVLALMAIMIFMVLTGMFMVDLVRNVTSFEEPFSTSMLDSIIKTFGMKPN